MSSVLVVAIEHDMRVSLRKALEARGYSVETAPTGRSALDMLQTIPVPSAIILDNEISPAFVGSGEFISTLRTIENLKKIPVILMILKGGNCDGSQVQASVYKPVDLPELLGHLHKFCKK